MSLRVTRGTKKQHEGVLRWLKACTGYVQAHTAFKTRLESIARTIAPTQPKNISKMSDRRVYFHKS